MRYTVKCSACMTVLYRSDKEPQFTAMKCSKPGCKRVTQVPKQSTSSEEREHESVEKKAP